MAKKEPAAPNPAIKRAIDAFHQQFLERFGFKPVIHGGKDGDHFKKMLATWDEETVQRLITEFFTTTYPRVLRSDYSVGALFTMAQDLLLRQTGHAAGKDARTVENLDAAARAMGRK